MESESPAGKSSLHRRRPGLATELKSAMRGERYEEAGSRSLTITDLKRFRSLTLTEKTFAVLAAKRVMGITVGVGLTLAVFCIR